MLVACRRIEKTVFIAPHGGNPRIIPASGNLNILIMEIQLLLVDDRILTDTVDVDDDVIEVDGDKPRHVRLDDQLATDIQ